MFGVTAGRKPRKTVSLESKPGQPSCNTRLFKACQKSSNPKIISALAVGSVPHYFRIVVVESHSQYNIKLERSKVLHQRSYGSAEHHFLIIFNCLSNFQACSYCYVHIEIYNFSITYTVGKSISKRTKNCIFKQININ